MEVKLSDLKLENLRNEIPMTSISGLPLLDEEGNAITVKVFNPTGLKRLELIDKLKKEQSKDGEESFVEDWYGYLFNQLTSLEMDNVDLRELFENPRIEFNLIRKEIEAILHEVYVERLIEQISEINNIKTAMYTELMLKKVGEIEQIAREIKEIDPNYGVSEVLLDETKFGWSAK